MTYFHLLFICFCFTVKPTAPGPSSYIGSCTVSDTSCYDGTLVEGYYVNIGDVRETERTTYVLSVTSNSIYLSQSGQPTVEFTFPGVDPLLIRRVGVQSHCGDNTGVNDHVSYWTFCTDGKLIRSLLYQNSVSL